VLVGLVLLGTTLSDPTMLSGWHFGTAASGAGLDIGVNAATLPFLLLTITLLVVVMLISLPLDTTRDRGWILILGAGAILLFVSTNQLSLTYTALLFDILLAYHWLIHKRTNLSIARLFLGIFTAGALMLGSKLGGTTLLGLALWLRLGLYPFFEIHASEKESQNFNFLTYWSFSLAGGIYLVIQTQATPLPEILHWLIVITMLLNGLLAWLFQTDTSERPTLITRLVFPQALLPLLLIAPSTEISTALALGLTLSLAALWATPQLGQIHVNNLIKSWPYLATLAATLTLIGLPFSLNWPVWATFYPTNFSSDMVKTILVMLAIALAMSGLTRYWLNLWHSKNTLAGQSHLIPAHLF